MTKILTLKKSQLDLSADELKEALESLKLRRVLFHYIIKGDDLRMEVDAVWGELILSALNAFDEFDANNNPTPKRRTSE